MVYVLKRETVCGLGESAAASKAKHRRCRRTYICQCQPGTPSDDNTPYCGGSDDDNIDDDDDDHDNDDDDDDAGGGGGNDDKNNSAGSPPSICTDVVGELRRTLWSLSASGFGGKLSMLGDCWLQ